MKKGIIILIGSLVGIATLFAALVCYFINRGEELADKGDMEFFHGYEY